VVGQIYLSAKEKEEEQNNHKSTLKILILVLVASAIIANSVIIFSDTHKRHSTALWMLNITAAIASSLGIIAVCRHGFHGLHGKSYLFLTLGLISWFCADFTLLYYYYALGLEEQKLVSVVDGLWFIGYGFLSLHLLIILRSLHNTIKQRVVIIVLTISLLFVGYNVHILLSSEEFIVEVDFMALLVTLAYPILDLTLIVPSGVILISLRKSYQQFIPWILSSLSLLINAIADDGYVHDFVSGNSQNLWFWELFYVTDFIIMAGALFWYNRFHISDELRKKKKITIE
jgi:hypothetical protein